MDGWVHPYRSDVTERHLLRVSSPSSLTLQVPAYTTIRHAVATITEPYHLSNGVPNTELGIYLAAAVEPGCLEQNKRGSPIKARPLVA